MNTKQAYRLGVESGLEAGRLGDFSPAELDELDASAVACADICENKRQYAGHPGYEFNAKQNAELLWDAFEEGEAVGIRKAWRDRQRRQRERVGLHARPG